MDDRGATHGEDAAAAEGVEPDPRFTLANERTFLAWNRTALALVTAGLVIAQLLRFEVPAARLVAGLPLIVLGGIIAATSFDRWQRTQAALRLGQPLPGSPLPRVLAVGIGIAALAAGVATVLELVAGRG